MAEPKSSWWQRTRALWPHLYAILGSFALLVALGHGIFISLAGKTFESFWKLSLGRQAVLLLGVFAFEAVAALILSLILALLLGLFPFRLRLGRLRLAPVAVLFALGSGIGLLLLCFSHASNLYLGSFMDLPLIVNVLLQIQQWFAYSHHNDPVTLYTLLGGGSVLIGIFAWLLGRPQDAIEGNPGRVYRRTFDRLSRHVRIPALASVLLLGLLLGLMSWLKLADFFAARMAPEIYLVGRLLESPPPPPPNDARYTADRRQLSMKEFVARAATQPKLNVIVLEIESWSATRTGFHGAARPTTPNLDRLTRQSLMLPNTIAVSSHSEYAQMAILSSLHPLKYPYHDPYRRIEYPRVLLHNVLAGFGYRTAMFSSQDERWQNNINFLFNGDWDVFWFAKNFAGPHYGHGFETKILDEYTVAEAIPWLTKKDDKPFFAYLNFQRTHHPYTAPAPWNGLFTPSEMTQPWSFHYWPPDTLPIAQNRYDNSLRYVDAQVGKLLEALRTTGLDQSTILVIVGDHGENIGPGAPPPHCCRLVMEEIRTPLLIAAPGLKPGVDPRALSTLDIPPLIARLLGIPPHPAWQGIDALQGDGSDHPPIYMLVDNIVLMDGIIEWPWKLVINSSHRSVSLTHLELDPYESRDWLAGAVQDSELGRKADSMLAKLKAFRGCQLQFYGAEAFFKNFYPTCQ